MIDKRTEASVNYAEILAKGLNATAKAEEPAAAAVSWNATPSINMAAAMASLMMGSAAQESSAPTFSSDAIRDAAEFAENKAQLKNMLADAQRVVASMQPGPEKTQAQGVIAAASGASPTNIRAVLEALKDMIEQAKSKEVSSENILIKREQDAAEREARIRQLREQAYDLLDKVDDYIDEPYKKELKEKEATRKAIEDEIAALEAAKKAGTLDAEGLARLNELKKEELPEARIQEAQAGINAAQNGGQNARAAGKPEAAEIADQAVERFSQYKAASEAARTNGQDTALSANAEKGAQSQELTTPTAKDATNMDVTDLMALAPNVPKQQQPATNEQLASSANPVKKASASIEF